MISAILAQTPTFTPGMEIRRSVSFSKLDSVVKCDRDSIHIKGSNLVIDFGGSTLRGGSLPSAPESRKGTLLKISGKNITIRNLKALCYERAIEAIDAPGLRLENITVDYPWQSKLTDAAGPLKPAIWINRALGATISNVTVRGGNTGLLLERSPNAVIFNSNIWNMNRVGIGLRESSGVTIQGNSIQGVTAGYYDAAPDTIPGIGIEADTKSQQLSIAYNSINRNMIGVDARGADVQVVGNDFSGSVYSAADFAGNKAVFINNLVRAAERGVRLKQVESSLVAGNFFQTVEEAIYAYRARRANWSGNSFDRVTEAIVADGEGSDFTITENRLQFSQNPLRLWDATRVKVSANEFLHVSGGLELHRVRELVATQNLVMAPKPTIQWPDPKANRYHQTPMVKPGPPTFPNWKSGVQGGSVPTTSSTLSNLISPFLPKSLKSVVNRFASIESEPLFPVQYDEYGSIDDRMPSAAILGSELVITGPPGSWRLGDNSRRGSIPARIQLDQIPDEIFVKCPSAEDRTGKKLGVDSEIRLVPVRG